MLAAGQPRPARRRSRRAPRRARDRARSCRAAAGAGGAGRARLATGGDCPLHPLGAACRRPRRAGRRRAAPGRAELHVAGPRASSACSSLRGARSAGLGRVVAAAAAGPARASAGPAGRPSGAFVAVVVGALTNDSGPDDPADRHQLPGAGRRVLARRRRKPAAEPASAVCAASKPRRPTGSIATLNADRPRLPVLLDSSREASPATSTSLPAELIAQGHDVRVLAPVDPDDRLTRALHRRAAGAGRAARLPDPARPHRCSAGERSGLEPVASFRRGRSPAPRAARGPLRRRARARADRAGGRLGRLLLRRRAGGRHLPRLLDEVASEHDRQRCSARGASSTSCTRGSRSRTPHAGPASVTSAAATT